MERASTPEHWEDIYDDDSVASDEQATDDQAAYVPPPPIDQYSGNPEEEENPVPDDWDPKSPEDVYPYKKREEDMKNILEEIGGTMTMSNVQITCRKNITNAQFSRLGKILTSCFFRMSKYAKQFTHYPVKNIFYTYEYGDNSGYRMAALCNISSTESTNTWFFSYIDLTKLPTTVPRLLSVLTVMGQLSKRVGRRLHTHSETSAFEESVHMLLIFYRKLCTPDMRTLVLFTKVPPTSEIEVLKYIIMGCNTIRHYEIRLNSWKSRLILLKLEMGDRFTASYPHAERTRYFVVAFDNLDDDGCIRSIIRMVGITDTVWGRAQHPDNLPDPYDLPETDSDYFTDEES